MRPRHRVTNTHSMAEAAVLEACKRFTDSVVEHGAERLQATELCKSLLLASSSGQRQHRQVCVLPLALS